MKADKHSYRLTCLNYKSDRYIFILNISKGEISTKRIVISILLQALDMNLSLVHLHNNPMSYLPPTHFTDEETETQRDYFILFLAASCSVRDLSSPSRDRTHTPCSGGRGVLITGPPGSPEVSI